MCWKKVPIVVSFFHLNTDSNNDHRSEYSLTIYLKKREQTFIILWSFIDLLTIKSFLLEEIMNHTELFPIENSNITKSLAGLLVRQIFKKHENMDKRRSNIDI